MPGIGGTLLLPAMEGVDTEKRIRVSTQGRLTIPKAIRDSLKIADGQAIVIRSSQSNPKELVIELQPKLTEF